MLATLPDGAHKTLDVYKMVSKWMFIAYVVAFALTCAELVVGIFAICSRWGSCVTTLISSVCLCLSKKLPSDTNQPIPGVSFVHHRRFSHGHGPLRYHQGRFRDQTQTLRHHRHHGHKHVRCHLARRRLLPGCHLVLAHQLLLLLRPLSLQPPQQGPPPPRLTRKGPVHLRAYWPEFVRSLWRARHFLSCPADAVAWKRHANAQHEHARLRAFQTRLNSALKLYLACSGVIDLVLGSFLLYYDELYASCDTNFFVHCNPWSRTLGELARYLVLSCVLNRWLDTLLNGMAHICQISTYLPRNT